MYENIKAQHDFENFDIVVKVIDTYFKDLFNLESLDDEYKDFDSDKSRDSSHMRLFRKFMPQLEGLFTEEEVIAKVYKILNSSTELDELILRRFVIVPPTEHYGRAKQIGFLEKLAVGDLKEIGEPLTSLDMRRFVRGLETFHYSTHTPAVAVAHIYHLQKMTFDDIQNYLLNINSTRRRALLVNFNRDPKGTPKWGVVDLQKHSVFCETPLSENEKVALNLSLNIQDFKYLGGDADGLVSTGYSALAWLDSNITKKWNFDVSADFSSTINQFEFMLFSGDNPGCTYKIDSLEKDAFMTEDFRHFLKMECLITTTEGFDASFRGGSLITRSGCIAALGEFVGEEYTPGDLSKLIKLFYRDKTSSSTLNEHRKNAMRTRVIGLDMTLTDNGYILQDQLSSRLIVPEDLNYNNLSGLHSGSCSRTNTNTYWLAESINNYYPSRDNLIAENRIDANLAAVMVLAFIRAKSKRRFLQIKLPSKFQLSSSEQNFIVRSLSENPFVTNFAVDNTSLFIVKERLIKIFARNRLLFLCGYRPPLVDNFWRQAARRWLTYLYENQDILELKAEFADFKRSVLEMGVDGLDEILVLLADPNAANWIDEIYGVDKRTFYAACPALEYYTYLQHLLNHLQNKLKFPFNEFGISYQAGNDYGLISLFREFNTLDNFERVVLVDCLKNQSACEMFLSNLTRVAHVEKWTGLIIIPELENSNNRNEITRSLCVAYRLLNDVISRNRQKYAVINSLSVIDEVLSSSNTADYTPSAHAEANDSSVDVLDSLHGLIKGLGDGFSLPIMRDGAVQLQMQMQQQIEQVRQVQQEHQRVVSNAIEQPIAGELIDYNNIDRLLGSFWKEYCAENQVFLHAAHLKTAHETVLQSFFHTWINANPEVQASQIIHKMTSDAAKALLRKHGRLPSGLNPENLPKGFYTQRSENGDLILCYSPEIVYVSVPNPLTIDLDVRIPVAKDWEGDFRIFQVEKYLEADVISLEHYWSDIVFFAKLQPLRDHSGEFQSFVDRYGRNLGIKDENLDKIKSHWVVFFQAWQYGGKDGVTDFLRCDDAELTMTTSDALQKLLEGQSSALIDFAVNKFGTNDHFLRALGQIYPKYGSKGINQFLTLLHKVNLSLGDDFFEVFLNSVLTPSQSFNYFISERFFMVMNDMVEQLNPTKAYGQRMVWQDVLTLHMHAVEWDKVEKLWNGFKYFYAELVDMGIELKGDNFKDLKEGNMLVSMDRILESLRKIPRQEDKIKFVESLSRLDLNYGGVHYALQHERFKYFDESLELEDFRHGTPTYAVDLSNLYQESFSLMAMSRTLASKSHFGYQDYTVLIDRLRNNTTAEKNSLIFLLHTQYQSGNIASVLNEVIAMDKQFSSFIALHIHKAVYRLGVASLVINLDAMRALNTSHINLRLLLNIYQQGTVLEALSIVHQSGRDMHATRQMIDLFSLKIPQKENYPDSLYFNGYKLSALFGVYSQDKLQAFYDITADLKPIVRQELDLLITQLLSIDYEMTEDLSRLTEPDNWDELLQCVHNMKMHLGTTSNYRIDFIDFLDGKAVKFKYSKSGEFRTVNRREKEAPDDLGMFVDHDVRLWNFMQMHLVVPSVYDDNGAKEELSLITRFLKRMQLSRTYLNEIEPLLASLEANTHNGTYWSVGYFYDLLRALQPEDDQSSFPISLLKVLIQNPVIAAQPIDSVKKDFPNILTANIRLILSSGDYSRDQQANLCKIAFLEYEWSGAIAVLPAIINTLALSAYQSSRGYVLEILVKSTNTRELELRFEKCCSLLQHPLANDPRFVNEWVEVSSLWLKSISSRKEEEELYNEVIVTFQQDLERQALVLKIVAFSSLQRGLQDEDTYQHQLNRKTLKLVKCLKTMPLDDLNLLASRYPKKPFPNAEDILSLVKKQKLEGLDFAACLDDFSRNPYSKPRADYGHMLSIRDDDFQRMIADTKVSGKDLRKGLSVEDSARLMLAFSYLKELESGVRKIAGYEVSIREMSQNELVSAFKELSMQQSDRNKDVECVQIWAILFEILTRTTNKYPHLAQQFALIANDLCIKTDTRVLQLATGEGKSHFVAMRAARNAGMGKKVDVCTAKKTLAERDLKDYQDFFDYLELKTSYIHAKSSAESYNDSDICYTTVGDLSLFLDEQSYRGMPIDTDAENRVGLFDEFDFILFEEGRKTQYNYAQPTGKTPKQMTWFYQAVNNFYNENRDELSEINNDLLFRFSVFLSHMAGENEERQALLLKIGRDPLQLAQWLQSAYEANRLVWGVEFTVREVAIEVGDETYPMREIIPLSTDNQTMFGSTFSAGVHQLLAVRLNSEARNLPGDVELKHRAQNFHIHPESNIVSSQVASQRMKKLWRKWEGFSGTISAAQAKRLQTLHGTEVLHVPTNQRDLRLWHKPEFFTARTVKKEKQDRMNAVVAKIRICIKKKQSMLFSCRNDAHVAEIREELKNRLTPEELSHFMFYTNEDERSPAAVLEEKRRTEDWRGGKKQKSIGLIASGFGRGDNVGVEAVFLFDVNDNNDKLQKGGRTARNGEEGEVFQFYLMEDLIKERENILNSLQSLNLEINVILEIFEENGLDLDDETSLSREEKIFEQIMYLREYLFSLQNTPNEEYHSLISELSSFAMLHIGRVVDSDIRQELSGLFSAQLQQLEKEWIRISGSVSNGLERVEAIKEKFKNVAETFSREYIEKTQEHIEFTDSTTEILQPELVVTPPTLSNREARDVLVSRFCSHLVKLDDLDLTGDDAEQIPTILSEFCDGADIKLLRNFDTMMVSCRTVEQFRSALEINLAQKKSSSHTWFDVVSETESFNYQHIQNLFLAGVSNELREEFQSVMNGLTPTLQEGIILFLNKKSLLEMSSRIEKVLPILHYLVKFKFTQQNEWGEDYIFHLEYIQQDFSGKKFQLDPMMYRHFAILNALSDSDEDVVKLDLALRGDAEHRLRVLSDCQLLSTEMSKSDRKEFFDNFVSLMPKFKEGEDWDIFSRLVANTKSWWHKADNKHQSSLQKLWRLLAEADNLSDLSDFMRWAISFQGKSWYLILSSGLEQRHLSMQVLNLHTAQFKSLWLYLDSQKDKQAVKVQKFVYCCQGIERSYQLINHLNEDSQDELRDKLLNLGQDGARIDLFMRVINDNFSDLMRYPEIFQTLLECFSAQRETDEISLISIERLSHYSDLLIDVLKYQDQADFQHTANGFIRVLNQFIFNNLNIIDDSKFNFLMRFISKYLQMFLIHLNIYNIFLSIMTNLKLSEEYFNSLMNVIHCAFSSVKFNARNIYQFLGYINSRIEDFVILDQDRFQSIINLYLQIIDYILNYVGLHVLILDCVFDSHICLDRLRIVFDIVVRACNFVNQLIISQVIEALRHFILQNNDDLLQVELRLLNNTDSLRSLFDNLANFCMSPDISVDLNDDKVSEVISLFYRVSEAQNGNVDAILDDADVSRLFAFSSSDVDEISYKRITWMHLLLSGSLTTRRHDLSREYAWSKDQNDSLIELCLSKYSSYMRDALAHEGSKVSVYSSRDLNVSQQGQLLEMCAELESIGRRLANPIPKEVRDDSKNSLVGNLNNLLGKYSSVWFKSISRHLALPLLIQAIDQFSERDSIYYEQILLAIHRARNGVIESDIELNQSRGLFFKLNRGGQSRLYNTLNQMEDEVLRHWGQNTQNIMNLPIYNRMNMDAFNSLLDALFNTANDALNDNNYMRNNRFLGTVMFSSVNTQRQGIESVMAAITDFRDDSTSAKYQNLLVALNNNNSSVPGNVKTLVREVLARGESLKVYIEKHHDEVQDIPVSPASDY